MTLETYTQLIKSLPYLDQAFETSQQYWYRNFKDDKTFTNFCKSQFVEETIKISRNDLFIRSKEDFYCAIVSIIFWGYPRNMRGNNFSTILKSMPDLKRAFGKQRDITIEQFDLMRKKIEKTGVGLSTLTKFLYFFGFTVNGYPCLIFDSRIIAVINDKAGFKELQMLVENNNITEFNKGKKYPEYLKIMNEISNKKKYKPDQLELFLFSMGKNLKTTIV